MEVVEIYTEPCHLLAPPVVSAQARVQIPPSPLNTLRASTDGREQHGTELGQRLGRILERGEHPFARVSAPTTPRGFPTRVAWKRVRDRGQGCWGRAGALRALRPPISLFTARWF